MNVQINLPQEKVYVVRPFLLKICSNNECAAAILSTALHRHNELKWDTHFISQKDIFDCLFGVYSLKKISKSMRFLFDAKLILEAKKYTSGRQKPFKINTELLNELSSNYESDYPLKKAVISPKKAPLYKTSKLAFSEEKSHVIVETPNQNIETPKREFESAKLELPNSQTGVSYKEIEEKEGKENNNNREATVVVHEETLGFDQSVVDHHAEVFNQLEQQEQIHLANFNRTESKEAWLKQATELQETITGLTTVIMDTYGQECLDLIKKKASERREVVDDAVSSDQGINLPEEQVTEPAHVTAGIIGTSNPSVTPEAENELDNPVLSNQKPIEPDFIKHCGTEISSCEISTPEPSIETLDKVQRTTSFNTLIQDPVDFSKAHGKVKNPLSQSFFKQEVCAQKRQLNNRHKTQLEKLQIKHGLDPEEMLWFIKNSYTEEGYTTNHVMAILTKIAPVFTRPKDMPTHSH
ncbi:hypothetical protein [Piscirickettsia litoralis]|uniref:Uncharacterized protein n=1 Tax=Piscirickettsia litoralis TaxID=1891921 RepID=A0ABX2ZXJ3_9GAMM|nr:hypothetical protein [Piscirickettsia litoralis]ODN41341.1 hypothetical protein BGC07_16350 [Piscirickettsia litoralis]